MAVLVETSADYRPVVHGKKHVVSVVPKIAIIDQKRWHNSSVWRLKQVLVRAVLPGNTAGDYAAKQADTKEKCHTLTLYMR